MYNSAKIEKNHIFAMELSCTIMNIIDILIIFLLIYGGYSGFREGLIVQIFSLIGIVLSLWLGAKYCTDAAEMLHLSGDYSKLFGFLIATVVILIAIAFAGRALRQLITFTGMGSIDVLLGVLLGVVKFTLVLSLVFTALNLANQKYEMFETAEIKQSKLYMPIANISNHFTPAWNWINEQIDNELKKE